MIEVLKAVAGGGSAVAVIAVVVLFLRQQQEMSMVLTGITERFVSENKASQAAFQAQLGEINGRFHDTLKDYQGQIRQVVHDHMIVTRETITAMKSVESTAKGNSLAVKDLQATVKEMGARMQSDRK